MTGAAKVVVTVPQKPQKTDDLAIQNSAAEASAIDCKPWGCCCEGYADYFGGIAGKCMGCAPSNVSRWLATCRSLAKTAARKRSTSVALLLQCRGRITRRV